MDHRFSPKFFNAGAGWGGSCFPKDVSAIVEKSREIGYEPKLLEEVIQTNKRQKIKLVEQLKNKIAAKRKVKKIRANRFIYTSLCLWVGIYDS